jgi:FkbM family methyltransferase
MLPRVNVVRTDRADYLLFSTNDAISRTIYANGTWAEPLLDISRMFYSDAEAPLIIDVGANLGAYSVRVAKDIATQSGCVYSYEPQRIIYYQLCGNVFLNRLDNIYAFNMAIGEQDGSLLMPSIDYDTSANIGGFSFDQESNERLKPVGLNSNQKSSEVAVARLDSLTFPGAPALVKIDVEGLELQVLKGARGFLEEHSFPPLLLEAWTADWFSDRRQALLDFLSILGYEYFSIHDELIAQHPKFPRQIKFVVDANSTIQMIRVR